MSHFGYQELFSLNNKAFQLACPSSVEIDLIRSCDRSFGFFYELMTGTVPKGFQQLFSKKNKSTIINKKKAQVILLTDANQAGY